MKKGNDLITRIDITNADNRVHFYCRKIENV